MIRQAHASFRAASHLAWLGTVLLLPFVAGHVLGEAAQSAQQSHFVHSRFTTEDGLYSNLVEDMVQSQDGSLWLRENGTDLTRFDGQHFDASTRLGYVTSLALAPNGDLWVGTREDVKKIAAEDLEQFDRWPFLTYPLEPKTSVTILHFTRNNVLWVGTNHGLYRFEQGKFLPAIQGPEVERIEEEANGRLWITTTAGPLEWDGARAVPHPEFAAQLGVAAGQIFHVLEDTHGVTWFCTGNGVARQVNGAIEKLQPWGPNNHSAYRVYEDANGTTWISRKEGLFRVAAGRLEAVAAGVQARNMLDDRDGNLWVGTNGDGLHRFKNSAVRTYTTADGLPSNVAMTTLAAHDGALWTGFNCGGISRLDEHGLRIYKEKDGLLNSCVWSLAEDSNHDLWIGTWGGGVFRLHEGTFTQYSVAQGLPGDVVRSVISARDGSIWLTAGTGVSQIRDGRIRNYTATDGLSVVAHRRVFEDRTGTIWVQSYKGGEERLVRGRFESYAIPGGKDGSTDRTALMGEDAAGALYFVTYSQQGPVGIFRSLNDKVVQVAADQGAPEMRQTRQGDLWLVSPISIVRFPPGGLDHPYQSDVPLDFETYGSQDGLPEIQPSAGNPVSALTPDGKLWIASNLGLISLDLPRMPHADRDPTIHVEYVTVGRNQQWPSRELELPAGTHHLELEFEAIQIDAPEKIRLQYRLDGVDSEWLDANPAGHAVYSTLPPGKHAFHIRASNRSGIWNRAGIVYSILQQPYFYQTRWFLTVNIAFGLLLIAVLYQLRMRQVLARVQMRLEERVAERTRIARDLHDTLLQSFNALLLRLQTASNVLPAQPDEAKRRIDRAIEQASNAITEGRDKVNELRSGGSAAIELERSISDFARELLTGSIAEPAPDLHVEVEGTPRPLDPIVRDEVYRIVTEAIRNAMRHAHARRIEVEIRYDEDHLRVRIGDNGLGIDAAILASEHRAGHWGLRGMRERAKLVGGTLEVWSQVDLGTEIELSVPASSVYSDSHTARWLAFSRLWRGED